MVDAPAWDAVCVENAGRPGVRPCVNDLPLGVLLPLIPFVLPLTLPFPLGEGENFPLLPFPLGPFLSLPLPSRWPFPLRYGEGATRLGEAASVKYAHALPS